jgi:phosphopantetheine--protein transferase-like protein
MIREGNTIHPIYSQEHSWETRETWENPAIYVVQTMAFTEYDVKLFINILSEDEVARSRRFRVPAQRDSYIITHALFRLKLGIFLNEKPETIQIEHGFLGKPYLSEYPQIRFNLSHCNGLSLIAFDTKDEIGVDVEQIRPEFDWEPVAKRFFSEEEYQMIRASGENELYTFNRLWTRKEALIKARGSGISEANLHVDVRSDLVDDNIFLKSLLYLKTWMLTVAVSRDSHKADIFLPGNNCFTFIV